MQSDEVVSTEVFARGALGSRLVAQLSGATQRQLGYWHSTELLRATVVPGRRGVPRLYSWIEYSKARAAAKLLRKGLPSSHLRANIQWLDQYLPHWYTLPLTTFQGSVIISPPDGPPHTILGVRQAAAADLIEAAPLADRLLETSEVDADVTLATIREMQEEGPLGKLSVFSDAVDMDPRIRSGSPIVRGTRVETGFLATLKERGEGEIEIATQFSLDPQLVERALQFELAIAA